MCMIDASNKVHPKKGHSFLHLVGGCYIRVRGLLLGNFLKGTPRRSKSRFVSVALSYLPGTSIDFYHGDKVICIEQYSTYCRISIKRGVGGAGGGVLI